MRYGVNEIKTYSFSNDRILDGIGIEEDSWERNLVRIINPMGEETSAMRTLLTPGMLEVLGRNYARNVEKVRAYEIGLTYMNNLIDDKALPLESYNLSIGLYGKDEDFFTLKGMVNPAGKTGHQRCEICRRIRVQSISPGQMRPHCNKRFER